MCLAIPMMVSQILDDGRAIAEADGVAMEVSLELVGEVPVGAYVIVHAGFAIEVLDLEEAEKTLAVIGELLNLGRKGPPPA